MSVSFRHADCSSMTANEHSLYSSYRENLLEHLFAVEMMRHVWLSPARRVEILKPQVDDGGYDLVLETSGVLRHIQLKANFRGSTVNRFHSKVGLASKPSGCLVGLIIDQTSRILGPFLWLGNAPGKPLPDLRLFRITKHPKGNAPGLQT
jgi:hypothetical protein